MCVQALSVTNSDISKQEWNIQRQYCVWLATNPKNTHEN